MGEGTSEAVARVEETRARLDAEVAEFQRRIPPMVDKAKRGLLAVAGAAGGAAFLLVGIRIVVKRRQTRRARRVSTPVRLLSEAADQLDHMASRLAS